MMPAAQAGALRYICSVRRIFVICVLLLGSAFLTQTVSVSIASYAHCCIADCDDGSACAMPGCQPCGTVDDGPAHTTERYVPGFGVAPGRQIAVGFLECLGVEAA